MDVLVERMPDKSRYMLLILANKYGTEDTDRDLCDGIGRLVEGNQRILFPPTHSMKKRHTVLERASKGHPIGQRDKRVGADKIPSVERNR